MTKPNLPSPFIVASLIVKNEAKTLPKLFESAEGLIDAWAIVDTGSTDGTMDVAVELGEKYGVTVAVLEDAWDDDFSRSRNVCLDFVDKTFAKAEWVFVMDADDEVVGSDILRTALEESYGDEDAVDVVSLRHVSRQADSDEIESVMHPWLFRRRLGLRFIYPVHMTLDFQPLIETSEKPLLAGRIAGVSLRHTGYQDADHRKNNWLRALRIVRTKLPENHPHRLYCEVRSLAALGSLKEAADIATKALTLHVKGEIVVPNTAFHLVLAQYLISEEGDAQEALNVLCDALDVDDTNPDVWANILMASTLGYMARSIMVAQGQPAMSVTAQKAGKILSAIDGSGLFAEPLPQHALAALNNYSTYLNTLGQ